SPRWRWPRASLPRRRPPAPRREKASRPHSSRGQRSEIRRQKSAGRLLASDLMLGEEFVYHDSAVVTDHFAFYAAVVVVVADAAAAAGVVEVVGDQAVFILILVVFAVHKPPTRGSLALEANSRGSHRSLSLGRGPGHARLSSLVRAVDARNYLINCFMDASHRTAGSYGACGPRVDNHEGSHEFRDFRGSIAR